MSVGKRCGVIYPTGNPAEPAKRCGSKAHRAGPCKIHGNMLAYMDQEDREAMKARYLRLVTAFNRWEDAKKEQRGSGRGDLKVREAFAALVEAARGRAA